MPGTGLGRRSHVPGTVPRLTEGRNQSRYDRHERRADHGCPKRGRASHRCAHPRGPHRAAARLRRRDHVPRPPVPRPRHRDRVQRRAAVREALAVDRGGTRPLDPRRAHLLPRPALVARAGTRLAARLDAERLRGRQDPERRRDVGRGLSRVLARAPARSAVVRDPDRDRGRDDAGARLPRLPDVGGARLPGVPRHRRRAPARGHEAVAGNGDRRPARLPARRRDQSPVPRPAARVPRRGRALRSRRLSPPSRCRSASRPRSSHWSSASRARSDSTARRRTSAMPRAPSRTGPSSTGRSCRTRSGSRS